MIKVQRHGQGEWANWSENLSGWVREQITFEPAHGISDGLAWCRAAGEAWGVLLGEAAKEQRDIRPVGAGWSFTDILATDHAIASTAGLDALFRVPADWLHKGMSDELVLAGGGATVKHLNEWLAGHRLSLETSGASNGQSIAGAIATGTHGSVPDKGGIQGHVVGMHLIAGPDRSFWLERPGEAILTNATITAMGAVPRREPGELDAALVHLGGLGVVNAVLLRVKKLFTLEVVQRKRVLDRDAIARLAAGDFDRFARDVYPTAQGRPYFVQVILNPFDAYRKVALIRILFEYPALVELPVPPIRIPFEPLDLIGKVTRTHPDKRAEKIATMMAMLYPDVPKPGGKPVYQNWGGAMGDPVHDGMGQLYTAAMAFERHRLVDVLDCMLDAFNQNNGGDLVFTLRFVREQAGLLAFTRFGPDARPTDAVVIDMDGLNTPASHMAAERVFKALGRSGIPFHFHWGKMNAITDQKVATDYGAAVAKWKAVRESLLDPALYPVFGGTALRRWGLM